MFQPIAEYLFRVAAGTKGIPHSLQRFRHVVLNYVLGQAQIEIHSGASQVVFHRLRIHQRIAAADTLLQNAEAVPHGSVGFLRHQCQGIPGDVHLFSPADSLHSFDQVVLGHPAEIQSHAPGTDGLPHLLRIGGGQDENHMCRRFFQGFQEGVLRTGGKHVHLVDDVDLVPAHHRRIVHPVDQVPYIIHTVVGCGIHLDDIQKTAFLNSFAVLAFAAGKLPVRRIAGAVQGLRQNSGRGGLTRSPSAGEQVGLAHIVRFQLMLQNPHDVLLSDDFIETLRPLRPIQS